MGLQVSTPGGGSAFEATFTAATPDVLTPFTVTRVTGWTEVRDQGACFDADRFTPGKPGWYAVDLNFTLTVGDLAERVEAYLRRNGDGAEPEDVAVFRRSRYPLSGEILGSAVFYVEDAEDYFDLYVQSDDASFDSATECRWRVVFLRS